MIDLLPPDPSELAALLRRIEKHAAHLAAVQDRATFEQRPESVQAAVECAVSVLYFHNGPTKAHAALGKIVLLLAPEISAVLQNEGASAAYRILHPENDE